MTTIMTKIIKIGERGDDDHDDEDQLKLVA
jgi:hypothetical protein